MSEHSHPDLEAQIEELATSLLGPKKTMLAGGGRYDESGVVHRVDEMYETQQAIVRKLENGAIRVSFPWQVWVAIITALGGLGVQLLQSIAGS